MKVYEIQFWRDDVIVTTEVRADKVFRDGKADSVSLYLKGDFVAFFTCVVSILVK